MERYLGNGSITFEYNLIIFFPSIRWNYLKLDRHVYSYLASSLKTNLILFPLKTKNFNTFPLTLDVKYKMHQLILDNKVYSIFA